MNPVGLAVARNAFVSSRASIIYYHAEAVAEVESACDARLVCLESVLLADAICVALPWVDGAEGLLRSVRLDRVHLEAVFIAWLRSPAIERALAHLKQNYAERVELQNLAVVAGMSKFHFVRVFTAILGVTPHRYQLLLRLAKAKAMLREGSEIAQVAAHKPYDPTSERTRQCCPAQHCYPYPYRRCLPVEQKLVESIDVRVNRVVIEGPLQKPGYRGLGIHNRHGPHP
jgi:AraC-like DNA-binding protein